MPKGESTWGSREKPGRELQGNASHRDPERRVPIQQAPHANETGTAYIMLRR